MAPSATQRREVYERAEGCCEYCRRSVEVRIANFEIDHIVSQKHGGADTIDNLCLSCVPCNRYKGSEIEALDPLTDEASKICNPRQQNWHEHFQINRDASLAGLTPEGRATIAVRRMNEAQRIEQRFDERLLGNYPCQRNP